MKRLLAILLTLTFCLSIPLSALAEYTVDADGNAVYDTAVGYTFVIDDVNGVIEGEDATIATTNEAVADIGSVWAIWFLAEARSEEEGFAHVYEAISDGTAMGGNAPSVSLSDGQILVVVHSSSSNPNDAETYPNWESKVAALAVKTGDWLVIESDITDESTDFAMLVVTKDEVLEGDYSIEPVESADDSEANAESSEETSEEPSKDVSAESESKGANAEPDNIGDVESEDESDLEIKTSVMKRNGVSTWEWVAIAGAAVVVIIIIFILIKNKKKK